MEMQQIRYFLALCDEPHFTRAAKRCGIAQPTLTRAIQQLEAEIGGPLFERNRIGARPTRLAIRIRPELARIERSAAKAKRKAERYLARPTQPTTMESPMRALSVAVAATIAILAIGAVLHLSRYAAALPPAQAGATIDPHALHLSVDMKSVPQQKISADLF
ncbi:MAG TPA: LysR family transcriptional regulator [Stellaceae bacterium]|jgi:DNA-binding transcriptional LysR family regulator|nr:LysR family transcriptional regulator [Stellaceae bacterium]